MRYLPNTPQNKKKMLQKIGVSSVDALFESIPEKLRLKRDLDLPTALSENLLREEFEKLSLKNKTTSDYISLLGAGAYRHYAPAVVNHILLRSEFFTAYTPYQPEISQGTLQSIFEYQTMMCQLTGMDISNASLYDGSTALAESVLMASRIKREKKILVARSVHPEYREVLKTYTANLDLEIEEIPFLKKEGAIDIDALKNACASGVSAVAVQSPNFFGAIEDIESIAKTVHGAGALLIVVVSEPLSLALLKPPGEFGADIATGEAQSFGCGLQFGGPYLGFLTTKQEFVRQMPGRIVGETLDADGKRGFVLTLATREQHIRRAKATSNICTNQALCALAASVYLASYGKRGLRKLAEHNAKKAHALAKSLAKIKGVELPYSAPFFNEFTIKTPNAKKLLSALKNEGILGGYLLERAYPECKDEVLVCVTETVKGNELKKVAEAVGNSVK